MIIATFVAVYRDCEACICLHQCLSKRQIGPLPEHSFQGSFVYCRSRSSFSHQLVRVKVTVQGADALAVVVPADGLGKKTAYIENDELLDVLSHSSRNRV
jgi:hypothetical protein